MKKKSLLLSSLALLVVAAIAFTGATYAWFVSGAAPSVEEMRLRVSDVGDIKIAAMPYTISAWSESNYASDNYNVNSDDAYFKSQVMIAEIENSATSTWTNPNWGTPMKYLNPVTAAKIDSTNVDEVATSLNFAAGAINFSKEGTSNILLGGFDTENFIKYDVYFSNESTVGSDYIVSLDLGLSRFFADTTPGYYAPGVTLNNRQREVIKSLRVAFVSDQITAAVNGSALVNGGSGVLVYEPDAGVLGTTGWTTEQANPGNKLNIGAGSLYSTVTGSGVMDLFKISSIMNGGMITDITKIVKVSVYIWLEGNDRDCYSGVAGGYFSSSLQFAIRESITP